MPANDDDPFELMIEKLERLTTLDDEDRRAIRALPFKRTKNPANHHLVREGHRPTECCLLLEGYA